MLSTVAFLRAPEHWMTGPQADFVWMSRTQVHLFNDFLDDDVSRFGIIARSVILIRNASAQKSEQYTTASCWLKRVETAIDREVSLEAVPSVHEVFTCSRMVVLAYRSSHVGGVSSMVVGPAHSDMA